MKVLVIAPHPDDETLGCGGSIFRHKAQGDEIYWTIVTEINEKAGWTVLDVKKRDNEIEAVKARYGFKDVFKLGFTSTRIDILPISNLIEKIADVYNKIQPEIIYMPFVYDVHTDHQCIAKAMQSTFKWFRYPYIKKVLMYETLSETEFNFTDERIFSPNIFVDISEYLDKKINVMKIYESEMHEFPFPRSEKTIRALAAFRGSQGGFEAAETFKLVYERI